VQSKFEFRRTLQFNAAKALLILVAHLQTLLKWMRQHGLHLQEVKHRGQTQWALVQFQRQELGQIFQNFYRLG
jgi:hypothetical protein